MDERGPLKEGEYYRGESPLDRLAQVYYDQPPKKKTKPKKPTEKGTPWAHDRKPNSEAPDDIYISEEDSDYAPAIKDVPQRDWFPDAGKYEDTTLRNEKLRGYRKSTNIEDRRPIAGAKGYVRPEKKPIRPTDKIRVGAGAGDKAKLR